MTNEKREPLLVSQHVYGLLAATEGFDMTQVQVGETSAAASVEAPKPFYAIRRADGEPLWGEYEWVSTKPGDWSPVDEEDPVDPALYEMVLMVPVVVERRVGGSFLCTCADGCDNCNDGVVELSHMRFDDVVEYLRAANAERRAHGVPLIELSGVEL